MKKELIIKIIMFLIVLLITTAGALATITQTDSWLKFDDGTLTDYYGNYSGTNSGTTNITGKFYSGRDFSGSSQQFTIDGAIIDNSQNKFSINIWVNPDSCTSLDGLMVKRTSNIVFDSWINSGSCDVNLRVYDSGSSSHTDTSIATLTTGSWSMLTYVVDGSNSNSLKIYINGVLTGGSSEGTFSALKNYAEPLRFGTLTGSGYWFNGQMDEVSVIRNYALTQAEIDFLYNSGSGKQPPLTGPATPDNFTIDAFNIWDNSTLNNFSAEINGVNYSTTTGNITTNLLVNNTNLFNLKVFNAYNNQGPHFNNTYTNVNVSTKKTAFMVQSDIRTQPREAWTNNTINTTRKYNGTTYTEPLFLRAGSYNISSLQNGSYKQKDFNTNIYALDNYTINLNDIYTTILNISVRNAYTGQNLTNWTGNITSGGLTYSFTTTNGSVTYPVLDSLVYLTYVQAPDYSINYANNYANITPSGSLYKYNFSLYSNNSVRVFIYNVESGVLITENMTITITGNASENTYYTTTGTYFFENLLDGNYTFKFIDVGGNYSLTSYLVSVADSSTQTLNAYLSSNAQQVIFTYSDGSTGQLLESVAVSQSKLINLSYVLIESRNTDITGRVQFNYLPTAKYRFTASKENYTSKMFELDPVLFTSYNVKLNRITRVDVTRQAYGGLYFEYTPKELENDANNTLTFILQSPDGLLEEYYINLSYGENSNFSNGSNAYGETFTASLEVLNSSIYGQGTLTFYYKSITGQEHIFIYSLPVLNGNPSIDTFMYNAGEDYGLGWFERVLIATGILIIVAGVVFLVAGATPSLVVGLMIMGYFSYIGFIPLWGVIISAFVGLIMLSRNPGASYG